MTTASVDRLLACSHESSHAVCCLAMGCAAVRFITVDDEGGGLCQTAGFVPLPLCGPDDLCRKLVYVVSGRVGERVLLPGVAPVRPCGTDEADRDQIIGLLDRLGHDGQCAAERAEHAARLIVNRNYRQFTALAALLHAVGKVDGSDPLMRGVRRAGFDLVRLLLHKNRGMRG